ncbi:MAG: hypothetical protein Q8L48_28155 [Archangium sp.]|nr:hypothetical protein [Archangium sp.]
MGRNLAVQLSLSTLVEQLDDLFSERATRAFRAASGLQRDVEPVAEHPDVARPDAYQMTSELLASPRVDEAKRARLVLLRRHLARAYVEAQTVEAGAKLQAFLQSHTFFAAAKTWTPREAMRELPRLANREGRVTLAAELSAQLTAHESLVARWLDGTMEAIAALKLTPTTFVEELTGRPVKPRLEAAKLTLDQTQDASLDLLGYALKKLDPMLSPRTASAHDAERTALAPWLFENFRREDLTHALSRTLGDLGLSPNADGRITIDSEARPGRDVSARCFELRVPDQIRLLLTPELGFDAYAGWLSAWGTALHRANVGRALPFVERRLGDRAVVDAVGLLFESFLLDEGWLKRYLRLTAHQAKEAARAFASRQLLQLRRAAGLALYSHEATGRGAWASLPDEYVPRLSSALGVEVLRGHTLFDLDVFGDRLVQLDAFSLEHVMRSHLQERFNEDFWRNPATGRWLTELASRGQHDDAPVVAKSLGVESMSLTDAARHRVQVMGA